MWTNPSQKSRQGSDPPIPAMPVFWEFLFRTPLPQCTIIILLSASSLAERGSHNNMLSLLSLDNLNNLEKWVGSILDQDKH